MGSPSQKRAAANYRHRLGERGMARFEVVGLEADRELIRTLAKRLAEGSAEAAQLRTDVARRMGGERPHGGILAALRRSPLVGAELDLAREATSGRPLEL